MHSEWMAVIRCAGYVPGVKDTTIVDDMQDMYDMCLPHVPTRAQSTCKTCPHHTFKTPQQHTVTSDSGLSTGTALVAITNASHP